MSWRNRFSVALGLVSLVAATSWGQDPPPDEPAAVEGESGAAEYSAVDNDYVLEELDAYWGRREATLRFGWWGTSHDGDDVKVGEYQDLSPSPFWDVDGIFSDGERTFDFFLNGLDQEANQTGAYFFDGNTTIDFDFQRFLRRRDHLPLDNFLGPTGSPITVVGEDLNVGDDYAIRVQELNARVQGNLTENLKYRVRLWGLRKFGERQANAIAHCFDASNLNPPLAGRVCHVLSQRQRIDWLTEEIEPALEWNEGPVSVEYAFTLRAFYQDDQVVTRLYTGFAPTLLDGVFPYGLVPDNRTYINRLKISSELPWDSHFYSYLHLGETENKFRNTDRNFGGYDLRLTNQAIDGLTVTGYFQSDEENNERPGVFLPEEVDPTLVRHPIDYTRIRTGVKGRYDLFQSCSAHGPQLTGGYEYFNLDRRYAVFETPLGDYDQGRTITNMFHVGTQMRWGDTLDSYVRYKKRFIHDPLFGVRETNGIINTSLPEDVDLIELGGSWSPYANFLLTGTVGLEYQNHDSEVTDFDQESYPFTLSAWYAPTQKFSVSAGFAQFTNFLDQNITLGDDVGGLIDPNDPDYNPAELTPITRRWDYLSRASVFNVGARYDVTECITLRGSAEYSRSKAGVTRDTFATLPEFFDVLVETTRYTAGIDWEFADGIASYFRYNYFDYEDKEVDFNSGTAHFFLAGLSARY